VTDCLVSSRPIVPRAMRSIGACIDEGRRLARHIDFRGCPEYDAPLLSDQSLGGHEDFPRDCPLRKQEGFPDMSRFSVASREATGQVLILTRQGISLP
jgi:hypothetical protein